MPQVIMFFDDGENNKINIFSEKWNISKHDTVKRMVRDFEDKEVVVIT